MKTYFCLRCSKKSISVEGLRCFYCGNDESRTADTEKFHLPIPKHGDVSSGYYEPATDAGNLRYIEDLAFKEPTQKASIRTIDRTIDFISQTVGRIGHENFPNIDNTSENKTARDFGQYTNANQDSFSGNFNKNCGGSLNQSYDIRNPGGSIRGLASQDSNLCEKSLIGECGSKYSYITNEYLRRQGTVETTSPGNNAGRLNFKDSVTSPSEYPYKNHFSNFSVNVEERQEKGNISQLVSSLSQIDPSIKKLENLVEEKPMAEIEHCFTRTLSKRRCGKCKKQFYKESTFYAHLQNNCNSTKPYKCGQCDKKFCIMSRLLEHQKMHTSEKPFKCDHCDYVSAWKQNLIQHKKTHTSDRPYKCSQCNFASAWKQSLDEHLITHTSEKPFKCDQCNFASYWKKNLFQHKKTHITDRPFKCNQCDFSTALKRRLKYHLKKHSNK